MSIQERAVTNSILLVAQPLILNVLSVAVVGYMARTLGHDQYGTFVFAFAFVSAFTPLSSMGLRAIMVRDIAQDKWDFSEYVGKSLALRSLLGLLTLLAVLVAVNALQYPTETRKAVYIASLTAFFTSVTSLFIDVFQAKQNVRYVAYIQLVPGVVLTIASVIVLQLGFGLYGLVWVYTIGGLLGTALATHYFRRAFQLPRLRVDLALWRSSLIRAVPFFIPTMVATLGSKMGIILLSKLGGSSDVATYAAANNLVEKLIIVPDGICTAMFPALAALYKNSHAESIAFYKKVRLFMIMLGLPLAIGTTYLASDIITLIYGPTYERSVPVLQVLIWWLFLIFLTSLQGWTLGAIQLEKKGAIVPFVATPVYVVLCLALIPSYQAIGASIALLCGALLSAMLFTWFISRHFCSESFELKQIASLVMANGGMVFVVWLTKGIHVLVAALAGALAYAGLVLATKLVSMKELKSFVGNRRPRSD